MPSHGTTKQRGYGWSHEKLRAKLKPQVEAGRAACWRCRLPIQRGQAWDLGHDDLDRTRYRGPEHALAADCPAGGNRATRTHAARRRAAPTPPALGFFGPALPTPGESA